MYYIRITLSFIFLVCFALFAHAEQQPSLSPAAAKILGTTSSWVNQSGSLASFAFTPANQPGTYSVTGTYVNNASGYRCQGTPYPLSGIYYANNQTLSFSVAWSNSSEDCQSVTGWTGYFDLANIPQKLVTQWNLAYSSSTGPQIYQGSDTFTLTSVVISPTLLLQ